MDEDNIRKTRRWNLERAALVNEGSEGLEDQWHEQEMLPVPSAEYTYYILQAMRKSFISM